MENAIDYGKCIYAKVTDLSNMFVQLCQPI